MGDEECGLGGGKAATETEIVDFAPMSRLGNTKKY